ncbi:MAG: response regulator [Chloroflexi bacterium]|nr:response regulator [Chloroflexota bacterium]
MDTSEQPQHIFCVNSHRELRAILHELFEEEHYQVTTTNFLPETFEQIEALQPTLLIIDLSDVRPAGWALLEELSKAAATRRIPVVALSPDPSLVERAAAKGHQLHVQRVLSKPFDLDQILDTVRSLIGPAG